MMLRKDPIIDATVMEGSTVLQKQWTFFKPSRQKLGAVLLALVLSGGVSTIIWQTTAKGDIAVLKQRLLGQVHLSTGTYSARTISDLNRLSWENGLEIIATLDTINQGLNTLESPPHGNRLKRTTLVTTKTEMNQSIAELNALLQDRKKLLHSAHILKSSKLYSPVYQTYLTETMRKITKFNASKPSEESLVQK